MDDFLVDFSEPNDEDFKATAALISSLPDWETSDTNEAFSRSNFVGGYDSLDELTQNEFVAVTQIKEITSVVKESATVVSENVALKLYAKTMESALNEHEHLGLGEALAGFCTSDLTTLSYFPKGNPNGYSHTQVHGLFTTVDHLHAMFFCAPDSLFLVHDTQLEISDLDGSKVIKSKFSCTGTFMYSLTFERDGQKVPPPPTVQRLLERMSALNVVDVKKFNQQKTSSVQIKTKATPSSKFDRYKQPGATVGAHIEYNSFSECSMQPKKKKFSDNFSNCGDDNNQTMLENSSDNNLNEGVTQSVLYRAVLNPVAKVQSHLAHVSSRFSDSDTLIVDSHINFIHTLLPAPATVDMFGVLKMHVNKENKVFMMEFVLASKDFNDTM